MRFYYTGAINFDGSQENQNASLGGYKSSSFVPNSRKNALFSEISYQEQKNGSDEIRGVVLKNETGATINDLSLYFIPDNTGTETFILQFSEVNPIFSISGASGEEVKITVPKATLDIELLKLLDRNTNSLIGGGDSMVVDLFDGTTSANGVTLHLMNTEDSISNVVFNFLAPDYATLGISFATAVFEFFPSSNTEKQIE